MEFLQTFTMRENILPLQNTVRFSNKN